MSKNQTSALSPKTSSRSPERLAELALALGGFGIGTGEFAIMALLPDIARDLHVDMPSAGHLISSYALGVLIGAPVLAIIGAKLDRRKLLFLFMAMFAFGNLASAFMQNYTSLYFMRFIAGFPHGAYFGVASLVAASLAEPGKRAQAVGRVMSGLTVATLVGTPLATWLGQIAGWRAMFAAVGLIAILTMVMVMIFVPKRPAEEGASPLRELGALRRKQVLLTLAIGAVGTGGLFSVFSYVAATVTQVSLIDAKWMPIVFVMFGLGMVLGNIVGSKLTDRSVMGTIGGVLLYDMAVMFAFPTLMQHPATAFLSVLLVGGGFALVPALQTRLMDVAADAQTLAAALNHSALNLANALGAWLGGLAIAWGYGWTSTGTVGGFLALAGLLVFAGSILIDRLGREKAVLSAQ
ncbi:MFS transporter [Brucella thiophenivorans]|uniref:Sugar (And other) transporter family protein n=1 Tax=Brucella thiophenivorans TaxID=571255 RepID=A0A256FJV1_9HYPH|nr:MFS transporter [Brucella thiophenivorans]OYR15133.1 sugar (and other) transporter family protein [Brucella thiophenivorans]